jgi:hypothetical protein
MCRKKYHNILDCRDNFREMLTMCENLEHNVQELHENMATLNSSYIERIVTEIDKI